MEQEAINMQQTLLHLHEAFYENTLPMVAESLSRAVEMSGRHFPHDKTQKEPLITKAYDAFRKQSKGQNELLPTDEYIEEMHKRQISEIETKMVGSQAVSDATLKLNSSKTLKGNGRSNSRISRFMGGAHTPINIETVQLNAQESVPEGQMFNGLQYDPRYKQANIVDMNLMTRIPKQMATKKNKNDFYRFLLQANHDENDNYKVNNDVFIPRSILKKNNAPGLVKEKRLE